MLAWLSDARVFASCSKRATRIASLENDAGSTLIATSRPSVVSRARYTSPMPPEPMGSTTAYEPNRVPEEIDICQTLEDRSLIGLGGRIVQKRARQRRPALRLLGLLPDQH